MTLFDLSAAPEGILLIDKPIGITSFKLVAVLRRLLKVKRIGHAGTLDPFATGVMIMLIGRNYTKLSDQFLTCDKAYRAKLHLGTTTDTYDCEGAVTGSSDRIPTLEEVTQVIAQFQGDLMQTPPMYSAKKIQGKKLYELARAGKTVERAAVPVNVQISLLDYAYPYVNIDVTCSKGTYIRSLAYDMGAALGCGAHLQALQRTRSGNYFLKGCMPGEKLFEQQATAQDVIPLLIRKY